MSERRRSALGLALLLAAIFAVYSHGFANGATKFDDNGLVFDNAAQQRFGWSELRAAFDPRVPRTDFGLQYTPLSDVSYALDRRLFGEDPHPYHWQGLFFHALAAAALFALVRRQGGSPECALLAGALFALHPLQVEAVTWIAGRRTAIAGAFMLCAMVAWQSRRSSRAAYAASILFALLANFSKQSAVVVAPLLAAVELTAPRPPGAPRERPWKTALAYLPHVAIMAVFVWLGIWVGKREGVIAPAVISLGGRLQLALIAVASYARMIAWPAHLQPIYRAVLAGGWTDPRVLEGAAVVLGGLAVLVATWRRAPLAAFGTLVAGIAIAPGLHALGSQVIADRYAYVTLGGVAVPAALIVLALARRERLIAGAVAAAIVLGLAATTYARIEVWASDVALFSDAVASDPENGNTRFMLGGALFRERRVEAGEQELRRAAALCMTPPQNGRWLLPLVLMTLGSTREFLGDLAEAESAYAAAFGIARPREIDRPACAYADFCLRRGRPDLARQVLETALARDPEGTRLAREHLRTLAP